MKYLCIQNKGVAPVQGYTTYGVSTTRFAANENTIGTFGSGSKHSVSLLLRNQIKPIVFCGNLRLDFDAENLNVDDGLISHDYGQVVVKFSGKDDTGRAVKRTEKLSFVLEHGVQDWTDISMAVREFISNAIDRTVRNEEDVAIDWGRLDKYGLLIELVEENQVRAKSGHTRVFIPVNIEIARIYSELYWRFLAFGDPSEREKTILKKVSRGVDIGGLDTATIYKQGVFVRKIKSTKPSLFDYNFGDELTLDESRNLSDNSVVSTCMRAICRSGDVASKTLLLRAIVHNEPYWETQYSSELYYSVNSEQGWLDIWQKLYSDKGVVCLDNPFFADLLRRKGYRPICVQEQFLKVLRDMGLPSYEGKIEAIEARGNTVLPATHTARAALDTVWGWLVKWNALSVPTPAKPEIFLFEKMVDAESQLKGYYEDGKVYINKDLDGTSIDLLKTVFEELCHMITGATDMSRDFQEYLIDIIVGRMERMNNE